MTNSNSDSDGAPEPPERVLAPGFVIDGKYVVGRLLGSGGSGSVYEAEHAAIGHRVAIKVVRASGLRRDVNFARFQREAKICGTIRHPHVGQIYDMGELEDGTPFMVMELHEGRSLGDILDESVLPIAAVIEVTRQLLAGLAAVHHAGVVHRDIKPDNAMIVRASSGDLVVKLVDFGISKFVRADIRERALTKKNTIIGSPDYMAPEQLRRQEVDARTDLYAVGVLLYQAVTGSLPFDGESLTDLMAAIVRDPVTPPSKLRTDCPPELEHLILKSISRDPADRFQSADEMSRQLAHVQRAVRYAVDPGLARLEEPLPPRPTTAKRSRGHESATTLSVPPPGAPVVRAADTQSSKRVRSRWRLLVLVAGAGCVAFAFASVLLRAAPAVRGGAGQTPKPSSESAQTVVQRPSSQRAELTTINALAPSAGSQLPAADLATAPGSEQTSVRGEGAGAAAVARQRVAVLPRARTSNERVAKPGAVPGAGADKDGLPSIRTLLDEAASAFVLGQTPRARGIYQQILDRQPTQADAWRGLCLTASRMGQRKDAERAFERYLKLRPTASDAARLRAQLDKLR
ncbi:MAG TPA: protein kinase [Polyangiales bacterium]|nr:protein kinase [Polyangiales bacterium]